MHGDADSLYDWQNFDALGYCDWLVYRSNGAEEMTHRRRLR
jgi:hypothetical protein